MNWPVLEPPRSLARSQVGMATGLGHRFGEDARACGSGGAI